STVIASPSDADRDIFTAIAWSASLLSEDSRAVLRDLAVFTSLVPLEAIAAVTGRHHLVDPLSTLVDAHLVEPVHAVTESHYRLHPLVRERATALLSRNPDHLAELEHRHTEWAAGVASEALRLARSGQPTASLALVGAVEPEILVALQRTTQAGDAVLAAQLLLGIAQCWFNRGPTATEQQWIERVTALAENHPVGSGVMAMLLAWRAAVGVDPARDAEGVAAALPDLHSALARAEPGWVRTRILILAVQAARAMDDRSAIEPLCREGIAEAQELDDQASLATFESFAAMLAHQRDAIPEAVHWGRQAFERALRVDDPQVVLTAAGLLRTLPPGTPLHDGSDEDVTAGVPSFEQLLDIARRTGDLRAVAWLLPAAAVVALHRGNIARSLGFSRAALRRARVSGSPLRSLTPLLGVIVTAQQRGDHGVAAQLQEAVRPFRDVLKPSLPPWVAREYGDQLFDGSPVSSDAHALDGIAVNSRL